MFQSLISGMPKEAFHILAITGHWAKRWKEVSFVSAHFKVSEGCIFSPQELVRIPTQLTSNSCCFQCASLSCRTEISYDVVFYSGWNLLIWNSICVKHSVRYFIYSRLLLIVINISCSNDKLLTRSLYFEIIYCYIRNITVLPISCLVREYSFITYFYKIYSFNPFSTAETLTQLLASFFFKKNKNLQKIF